MILVLISVIWQLNYQGQLFVISRRLYPTVLTVKTHRTDSEDHVWLIRGDVSKSIELWGDTKHTTQLHQLPARAPFTLQATLSDTIPFISMESWRFPATQATGWDVSSDVTKFRILQLYANEERLLWATANRKEDGWAHVIVLLSAVDKQTQWKKVGSISLSFLFVCTDLIHI